MKLERNSRHISNTKSIWRDRNRDLENEIKNLKDEKVDVETKVKDLMKRRDELEILIKNKEDELNYKKEVEVTTDKLKTYIKDLEVKPGAVRDALAALINNMDN